MTLNVGCGRDVRTEPGWINLDQPPVDDRLRYATDIEGDISNLRSWRLVGTCNEPAFTFDAIEASHVLEHVPAILDAVENLWHVAEPGCALTVRCPHGASDDAWGDPTHVRPMFPESFMYWGQGMYWRADYGYRGDWRLDNVTLYTRGLDLSNIDRAMNHIRHGRNFVEEMVATLYAVKPARPPIMESQDPLRVVLA